MSDLENIETQLASAVREIAAFCKTFTPAVDPIELDAKVCDRIASYLPMNLLVNYIKGMPAVMHKFQLFLHGATFNLCLRAAPESNTEETRWGDNRVEVVHNRLPASFVLARILRAFANTKQVQAAVLNFEAKWAHDCDDVSIDDECSCDEIVAIRKEAAYGLFDVLMQDPFVQEHKVFFTSSLDGRSVKESQRLVTVWATDEQEEALRISIEEETLKKQETIQRRAESTLRYTKREFDRASSAVAKIKRKKTYTK